MRQQGDVLLTNTLDGGEIHADGGVIEMSGGLETAVYLSLFGGNREDEQRAGDPMQWWGNLSEDDPARRYRSETQRILTGLPATSANLLRVEDAVRRDLRPLIDEGVIRSVEVAVSLTGPKRVRIRVRIDGDTDLEFAANWEASLGD
ncbi:MAG: hypothetical protein ACOC7J_05650 [Armatimonadota bacterium]